MPKILEKLLDCQCISHVETLWYENLSGHKFAIRGSTESYCRTSGCHVAECNDKVLTIFYISPQHFNWVNLKMNFGVKHTYVPPPFLIVLYLRLLIDEVFL